MNIGTAIRIFWFKMRRCDKAKVFIGLNSRHQMSLKPGDWLSITRAA